MTAHPTPPGALRHRDFRLLWLAGSASVVGDAIVTVALALFVIDRTGSATDLGLVMAGYSLPLVGFLLIGGVWADRLPRHRLMVATDLVRFALHGLLAALILTGEVRIWQIVVIEMLFGSAEAFFRPAATALLPQTVPEDDIQQANALVSTSNNVAEFAGPALAAALVVWAGAGAAFAVDAGTFLLSAAFLWGIHPRDRGEHRAAERRPVLEELREGYREVRSRDWVWATLVSISVSLFVALAPWYVLGPVLADQQYGDTAVYGLMAASFGAGTVAGSLLGIRWEPEHPMRLGILMLLPWPPAMALFAAGVSLPLAAAGLAVAGAGIALFEVWWLTALAERIPPERLSRVTSYDWMVSLGLLPLGYLLVGPLSEAFGAVEVFLAGCALALVATLAALLPRDTWNLRRAEGEPPQVPVTQTPPGVPLP
ncbi:MAG: MFS transporter [Solirubrobacterales bacterium]